jgi:hypothetical protein
MCRGGFAGTEVSSCVTEVGSLVGIFVGSLLGLSDGGQRQSPFPLHIASAAAQLQLLHLVAMSGPTLHGSKHFALPCGPDGQRLYVQHSISCASIAAAPLQSSSPLLHPPPFGQQLSAADSVGLHAARSAAGRIARPFAHARSGSGAASAGRPAAADRGRRRMGPPGAGRLQPHGWLRCAMAWVTESAASERRLMLGGCLVRRRS